MRIYVIFLFLSFGLMLTGQGQERILSTKSGIFFDAFFGLGNSFGDLKDRFGKHQSLGAGICYMPNKGFDFGIKLNYFFGSTVKEDVLAPYRTDFGHLIGIDGYLSDILLRERGLFTYVYLGDLIPLGNQEIMQHGLKVLLGIGYMEHKIRIQDDSRAVVQLQSDFGKGLDRLSNGLAGVTFVGYEFKSRNGKINFYTGLECAWGFTKNLRKWNYDTQSSDSNIRRNDILVQYKIAWYLPFFFGRHADAIEY